MSGFRPVDPRQRFPELELGVLERWREHDVFARQLAQRREAGAPIWSFYDGPPTANGRPGTHHVLSRAFKDVYPRYQSMRGHYVPRKAGWDCHGLPVELEIEKELGISSKAEIEEYGIAEFNAALPRVGAPLRRRLEPVHRAHRLLDRPRRPLRHPDRRLHRVGLVVAAPDLGRRAPLRRHKVVPYCPRCGTALSSHEVAHGYRDVEDPSVYVRFPVAEAGADGRDPGVSGAARRRLGRLDDHPVDVDLERRARRRPRDRVRTGPKRRRGADRRPRSGRAACSARTPRSSPTFPGTALAGIRYEPPFSYVSDYGPRGHTVLEADFVTTEDGTGDRPHSDRLRRGRLPARRAVRDQAPEPGARRRHLRRAGDRLRRASRSSRPIPRSSRRCARAGACCARRSTSTPTRTAGAVGPRCSTTRSRAGTSAPPTSAIGCWPRTRRSAGIPSTSSMAASASGWRATSTGHSPASAIGVRRSRSGSATEPECDGRLLRRLDRRAARARRRRPEGPASPLHRRGPCCAARTAEARCDRVEEVIDAWYDSGAMPFAQFHYPFAGEEEFRERFPADYICEAPGPDPGLVLLAAGRVDAALRPHQLPQLRLPRSDLRRRGAEDVDRAAATSSTPGRCSTPTAPTPFAGTPELAAALGRLPVLGRGGGRFAAPVHAHALEHVLVLGPVCERGADRAGGARLVARRSSLVARGLGSVGVEPPAGGDRGGDRAHGGVRLHDRRVARSRPTSRSSRTGTCGSTAGASGTATGRRSRPCATA